MCSARAPRARPPADSCSPIPPAHPKNGSPTPREISPTPSPDSVRLGGWRVRVPIEAKQIMHPPAAMCFRRSHQPEQALLPVRCPRLISRCFHDRPCRAPNPHRPTPSLPAGRGCVRDLGLAFSSGGNLRRHPGARGQTRLSRNLRARPARHRGEFRPRPAVVAHRVYPTGPSLARSPGTRPRLPRWQGVACVFPDRTRHIRAADHGG